jgi:amidase
MKFMRLLMFGTVMLMANGAAAQNSGKPFQLDEATISQVHAAYKSGALTSVKLVQAYLERIRACDQAGPKLNVVIFLNPRALEEAAALDEHFRRTGKWVGPLHGIPVLLKDNVNTKDMPTTAARSAWRDTLPSPTRQLLRNCAARAQSSSLRSTCTSSRSGVKRLARSKGRRSILMT